MPKFKFRTLSQPQNVNLPSQSRGGEHGERGVRDEQEPNYPRESVELAQNLASWGSENVFERIWNRPNRRMIHELDMHKESVQYRSWVFIRAYDYILNEVDPSEKGKKLRRYFERLSEQTLLDQSGAIKPEDEDIFDSILLHIATNLNNLDQEILSQLDYRVFNKMIKVSHLNDDQEFTEQKFIEKMLKDVSNQNLSESEKDELVTNLKNEFGNRILAVKKLQEHLIGVVIQKMLNDGTIIKLLDSGNDRGGSKTILDRDVQQAIMNSNEFSEEFNREFLKNSLTKKQLIKLLELIGKVEQPTENLNGVRNGIVQEIGDRLFSSLQDTGATSKSRMFEILVNPIVKTNDSRGIALSLMDREKIFAYTISKIDEEEDADQFLKHFWMFATYQPREKPFSESVIEDRNNLMIAMVDALVSPGREPDSFTINFTINEVLPKMKLGNLIGLSNSLKLLSNSNVINEKNNRIIDSYRGRVNEFENSYKINQAQIKSIESEIKKIEYELKELLDNRDELIENKADITEIEQIDSLIISESDKLESQKTDLKSRQQEGREIREELNLVHAKIVKMEKKNIYQEKIRVVEISLFQAMAKKIYHNLGSKTADWGKNLFGAFVSTEHIQNEDKGGVIAALIEEINNEYRPDVKRTKSRAMIKRFLEMDWNNGIDTNTPEWCVTKILIQPTNVKLLEYCEPNLLLTLHKKCMQFDKTDLAEQIAKTLSQKLVDNLGSMDVLNLFYVIQNDTIDASAGSLSLGVSETGRRPIQALYEERKKVIFQEAWGNIFLIENVQMREKKSAAFLKRLSESPVDFQKKLLDSVNFRIPMDRLTGVSIAVIIKLYVNAKSSIPLQQQSYNAEILKNAYINALAHRLARDVSHRWVPGNDLAKIMNDPLLDLKDKKAVIDQARELIEPKKNPHAAERFERHLDPYNVQLSSVPSSGMGASFSEQRPRTSSAAGVGRGAGAAGVERGAGGTGVGRPGGLETSGSGSAASADIPSTDNSPHTRGRR